MFVKTNSGTEILVHEIITPTGEVQLVPVKLTKGQISELKFDEFEEIK